jgi:hypothetical protein
VPSASHGWLAVGHNMPPAKAGFRVPFIVILALIGGEGGLAYPSRPAGPWAKFYRPYRGCGAVLRVRHLCNELTLHETRPVRAKEPEDLRKNVCATLAEL